MIKAELLRLVSTRLWLWSLVAAVLCGGGFVTLFALLGPENVEPPMPGLDTVSGVRSVLGVVTVTALVPAVIGTVAMTSEYRHRTITVTFLFAPRRWRILTAKLVAFAIGGVCYGLTVAASAGIALYAGGATASLTDFAYLVDAMAEQTGQAGGELLSAPVGALVLAGYALVACALAVAFPLRRDVT